MRRVGPVTGMTNTGPVLAADGTPFVNVNPAANTPGSAVPAEVFNILLNELAHLVEFAGITLSGDDTDLEQVRKAVQAIAALNIPALTAVTSAGDNDLLAISLAGGGHRKITVAQLFTGRSNLDQVARDQIALTNLRQILNTSVATSALVQGRQWELITDEWATGSSNYAFMVSTPNYYLSGGSQKTIFLTGTGAGTWAVPSDWNSANNTVRCFGGGGGGAGAPSGSGVYSCGGGGGGAYAHRTNLTLTPGASISYSVGVGGAAGPNTGGAGGAGGDTWFNSSSMPASGATTAVGAKGASGGAYVVGGSGASGGTGGAAASSCGSTVYSGGNGGTSTAGGAGGGGGGCAGERGNGGNGGNSVFGYGGGGGGSGGGASGSGGANGGNSTGSAAGVGGNNSAGVGGGAVATAGTNGGGGGGSYNTAPGAGGAGSDYTATAGGTAGPGGGSGGNGNSYNGPVPAGGLYGGGGGGQSDEPQAGGAGGQGLIVIQYTPTGNMTLVSPNFVVSSAPAYVDAYMLYKDDSGSAVVGTDITIDLSRDGGASWTAATLTVMAAFDGTYSILKARADVSYQPSGTTLKARIKTFNTKAQRISAPAIYAE